jgi:hypothetical protein
MDFSRRLIQKTRLEHDPTEDATATMELIQLKLTKSMTHLFSMNRISTMKCFN